MKLSKTLTVILAIGLAAVFVTGVGYKIYLSIQEQKVGAQMMSFVLKPEGTQYKVGDKIKVPVYLEGNGVDSTTVFDTRINYDTTKLKLVGATPGTFYDKYLTVKWETKESWFALAQSPSNPATTIHTDSPLMTLEFTAIGKSSGTDVTTTSTSTVYVAKTGGFHPQVGRTTLVIQ